MQDNNYDVLTLVSGQKGDGKSSATIAIAREYLNRFSFVCPHCGNEFFKNVYAQKINEFGKPVFVIPDVVTSDKAWIKCPEEYELDMKTGVKSKTRGCGGLFKFSQRKKIKWSAARFIAYDNKDIIDKIFTLPTSSPLIADEAIRFCSSQDTNKTDSRELKKLFTVIRPKKFWFFFNIPNVIGIDSKYREHMASFWLRMIERGVGVLFEKDKSETDDHWHLKELAKTLGVIKFFTPMEKIKKTILKHPCYFDTFNFSELPEDVYDDYELMRNSVNLKRSVEEMSFSERDYAKLAAYNLINNWDRIGLMVGKSRENRMTYKILEGEVFVNPLSRQGVVSDVTIRNWTRGLEKYVESGGSNVGAFDSKIGKVDVVKEDVVKKVDVRDDLKRGVVYDVVLEENISI